MSGFELDRQQTLARLSEKTEQLTQNAQEDLSKGLLAQLKQSSDIAKDLAALYSDRPYVYARVMQQLSRVLGKTKVRKLHAEVTSRAHALHERATQAAKNETKRALRSTGNSVNDSNEKPGDGKKEFESKEVTVNIPVLGIVNKTIKVDKEDGAISVSSSDFNSKFIKSVSATGRASKGELEYVDLTAQIQGSFLESEGNTGSIHIAHSNGVFTPSGSLSAKIKIPGLETAAATFTVGGANSALTATFAGEAQLFNNKLGATTAINASLGETGTELSGNLQVKNGTGGEGAAGGASDAGQTGGTDASGAQSSGPMQFSGTINVNASGDSLTGITGNLKISNLGFLANPGDSIDLSVAHDGQNFSAELGNDVKFSEFTLADGKSTATLTIDSASFNSESQMSGSCTVDAKIGDVLKATGNVQFANSALQSGTLTIDAPEIALPKENSFVTGNLSGTASFDASGFTGAECSGNLNLSIANSTCELVLESLTVAPTGVVNGQINQAEENEFKVGCLSAKDFKATISSESETLVSEASGLLKLDHEHLKSDENGIPITFSGGALAASGTLNLLRGEGEQLGNCVFSASLTGEAVSAEGTLTLENDYQVAGTKLMLCTGATASLAVHDNEVDPLSFSGDYKYGYSLGAGASGDGGDGGNAGTEGGTQTEGGAQEGGGNKQLLLSGKLTDCTLDLESGNLTGSATANLDADVVLGNPSGKASFSLLSSQRKTDSSITITFADSELTSVSGSIAVEGSMKFTNDNLVVEGYLKDFSYDVASNSFTGVVDAGLNENYTINDNLTLEGNKECGIKVTLASNDVTDIELDVGLQMTVQNAMFEGGKAVFDGDMKNAHVDVGTYALNADNVTVKPKGNVTMNLHNGDTKLTLLKTSSVASAIANSEPTFLNGKIDYTGTTKVLDPGKAKELKVKGGVNVNIADVKDPGSEITGDMDIEVTEDYILDKIDEYDQIDLMAGTKVKVDISNEGIDTVSGDIKIRYTYEPTEKLPGGLKMELKGEGMTYNVPEGKFNGAVSVTGSDDTLIQLGTDQTLTIKGPSTGLKANITNNELQNIEGHVGFEAHLGIGDASAGKSIEITEGDVMLGMSLNGGALSLSDLEITAKASCDFNMGKMQVVTEEACSISGTVDAEGLKSASLKGGVHLKTTIGSDNLPVDFEVAAGGDGMQYERGQGINGDISVTCKNETKLGNATHGESTYAYGLGSPDAEGGAPAATFTAQVVNNEFTHLSGSAGFYLREENVAEGADALHVAGNISFDYDVASNNCSAEGQVQIDEKELATFGAGEILVLKQSMVDIAVTNNQLDSVSGEVNLALRDGEGDYLEFSTAGNADFDCLETTSFSGTVSVTVTREKKLTKGGEGKIDLYMTPAGDSGITAVITDNNIDSMTGGIGFKTVKDGKDYFGGTVQGEYSAADGAVSGEATIELLSDIDLPEGKKYFTLKAGTNGSATVESNALQTLEGHIVVGIDPPQQGEGGAEILLTADGTVNVQESKIEHFEATASCDGAISLGKGLTLSGLSGSAVINDNKLENIKGSASIQFEKDGFSITGHCDNIEWKKGQDGAQDGFAFSGGLDVVAFDGKLSGNVNIDYNALENPNATPQVDGELDFKINEWLGGKIGVKFEGEGWDDPVVYGEMDVTNATLVEGRQLFGFDSAKQRPLEFSTQIQAGPVPLTIGAGISFGASIDMEPITFDAKIAIEDFHVKNAKGLPNFSAELACKSGLSANATIAPYLKFGLGIGGVLEAGVKIKGIAKASATAGVSITGKLEGGEEGLSGEIGLGFDLSADLSISVVPSLYASLLGMSAEYDITSWDFPLGELFKFSWGKKFSFGTKGTEATDDDSAKQHMDPQTSIDASAEASEDVGAQYAPTAGASSKEEAPEIPSAEEIGTEASKDQGSGEEGGFAEKMEQMEKIGDALGVIGEIVDFISGLCTAAIGGPIGIAIYLAIKILTGELDIAAIPDKVKALLDGIAALKALLADSGDILKDLIPEWMYNVIEFFRNPPSMDEILAKVVSFVEEKINGLNWPLPRLLSPVIDFVKAETDKIGRIAKLLTSGDAGSIATGILEILGFAFTSIGAIIDMLKSMWNIFCDVVSECVASGDIYVKYKIIKGGAWFGLADAKEYHWQFCIPGLCCFSGEGGFDDKLISKGMLWILGNLGLSEQEM